MKVLDQHTRDSVLDDRDCEAAARAWAAHRREHPVTSSVRGADRGSWGASKPK